MSLRLCLVSIFAVGLAACHHSDTETASADPRPEPPTTPDSRYLLTGSGDYVLSSAPPGVEVRVGSKLLWPEGLKITTERSGTLFTDDHDGMADDTMQ